MDDSAQNSFVSCREASKMLDFSISTIKRLCDQQILQVTRTSGGHRRICVQSILRWKAVKVRCGESRVTTLCPPEQEIPRIRDLILSQSTDFLSTLLTYIQSQGVGTGLLVDDYLLPSLESIAQDHREDKLADFQLHAAQTLVRDVVGDLCCKAPSNHQGSVKVIGGSLAQAESDLLSAALVAALRNSEISAFSLGSALQADALVSAAHYWQADLVWIDLGFQTASEHTMETIASISANLPKNTRLFVVGYTRESNHGRQLSCDFVAYSVREAIEFCLMSQSLNSPTATVALPAA